MRRHPAEWTHAHDLVDPGDIESLGVDSTAHDLAGYAVTARGRHDAEGPAEPTSTRDDVEERWQKWLAFSR